MKLYVDSNIFLNVWFEEMTRNIPVFYYSARLLDKVISCEHTIVISDLTIHELSLKTSLSKKEILQDYLKEFSINNKLKIVKISENTKNKAKDLSKKVGIHLKDAMHCIVAIQEKCIIITRDKDFNKAKNRISIYKPEEL